MRFLILTENTRPGYLHYHYRSLAASELQCRIKNAGYEVETIEWFRHWSKEDLRHIIDTYFKDEPKPIIAVSNPLDLFNEDLEYLEDIFAYAKEKFPQVTIIHGGNRRVSVEEIKHVDVHFLGRSMGIFDDWLKGKDLSHYKIKDNPLILMNSNINQYIDTPIIHPLYDNDCLSKNDVLGFEIGVGCKFNCTFCNYELRNSKIVNLVDSKNLSNFLQEAYSKYGVQNFYAIDDTINESEEKLEILAEAVSNLNYRPYITAWARLDLLNKPKQRELFKKIHFSAVWFGVESFNPNASKMVRKRTSMDHVFSSLEFLRDECPDTFKMASLIIGLNGDDFESIDKSLEKVTSERLLDALNLFTLMIKPTGLHDFYYLSELDKDPAKYGYKYYGEKYPDGTSIDPRIESNKLLWESDWTNNIEANKMNVALLEKYKDKILCQTNHDECASFRSMKLLKNKEPKNVDILRSKGLVIANLYKQEYIKRKKVLLGIS